MNTEENYWMCVTDNTNFKIINEKLIYGVKERHYKKIKEIKSGDKIVFYIINKKIVGVFEVITKYFKDEKLLFEGDVFPYRINLKRIYKTNIKEFKKDLEEKLNFLKNKISLGSCFQGTPLLNIPKKDFQIIINYLRE